ncbi:hypothetical protein MKW92_049926 [Papaver armeniacum]|nr:hypothetical protein MKW92_049926 [Papaver armeniacum]
MSIVADDIIATKHKKALEFIEEVTTDADKVQKQVLSEILSINSHVEYLQRYGLNGQRIANGDTSPILCGRRVTDFLVSSGTSGGERKIFPCIKEDLERLSFIPCLVMPVVNQYITGIDKGKAMLFMFSREIAYTPGGLPVSSALSRAYRSPQFKNRPYDPFEDYTSPVETILCQDFNQSTYSQCLCGLYQSKLVVRVGSAFITVLVRIILFIQKHWSLLCNDIRTGTIDTEIITDVSVREAVKKILVKPDPELADFIEIECKRDVSWKGIISRLWPNAKYIDAIITGSMSQYIPSMDFYTLSRAYRSPQFKNRPYDPFEDYTSPVETILCQDFNQSTYSQCLCGLYQSKLVVRVGSAFITVLVRIILFIKKHWSLLCNDIRTGTINTQIITDVSVREAVKKILVKPDPELADFIEIECKRDASWKGIISRLWPNAKYIDAIITGSMSQYIPSMDFYSNGLPFVSTWYACSETFFGINLDPLCKPNEIAYTFFPNVAYFEFLPILKENEQKNNNQQEQHDAHELVELANVKLGHEYEVFVTTYAGLYRYGIGDVLRVVGFKNTAPQFQFISRKKVLLSIDCEKTNELELQNAVQNAMKHLVLNFNVSLVDYTSYADTTSTSNPGHYVIYLELQRHDSNVNSNAVTIPRSVFEECCLIIEESLSFVYKIHRTIDKSIDPLEIKIVETGTFDKLMDYAASQGTSVISHYKTPRCLKNVVLLNSCVVSNYFSQGFPHYAPGLC